MTFIATDGPIFGLVDDHIHSARLMKRALLAAPTPAQLVWLGPARRARRSLERLLWAGTSLILDMVIVDLKAHSAASSQFVAEISCRTRTAGVPLVALADAETSPADDACLAVGADAVFRRHHDYTAYTAELAELSEFWVRETVTWPIRT